MADEEESGFTVVDKRRTTPPEPTEEAAPPAPTADADAEAHAGHAHEGGFPLPSLSVRDRLLMSIDILNQGAWISLGLIADPATGKIEKNLDSARIALDSVAFLVGKVEAEMDEQTRRELRRLVTDLQLNFVEQQNRP